MIHDAIAECDPSLHESLYANIILDGGSMQFQNMQTRLQNELTKSKPPNISTIKLMCPDEGKSLAWVGCSIIGSLSTFSNCSVSKQAYEEFGPTIVHRRCF
eukprot:TRINITY_DN10958_c0_g1_i1.p1 TRINITY_DN10958_c0_g1~~TRINITY_DN10958_c0_g1_i1.p1  ORF type:complete len:101 (+),score=6.72 TRINITY_DN10958_c0_g1_i1:516-818(+)